MKRKLMTLTLAVLTVGLLGSCSKMNERIDGLDQRVGNIENEKIASIENQIAAINSSIADLGTIRKDITDLQVAVGAKGEDISELKAADEALGQRIDELKAYVGDLSKYAEKDWVTATFATLEKLNETNTALSALEEKVNKLGETTDTKIAGLKTELTNAIDSAISGINATINTLEGRISALEQMIQTVSIIPAYSNGSLKAENGILTINCVITPKKAVESLTKGSFTIFTSESEVLTKSALYGTITIASDEDLVLDKENGTATIKVDVSDVLPAEEDKALTVAVNVKNGISDFTTEFVPVTVAGGGSGTADKPYLIRTPEDLCAVSSMALPAAAVDAVPTYFKLLEDIDMTGVEWKPINDTDDHNLKIDFNGNGHTISNLSYSGSSTYPSIFGVAFGEFYDLTIDNATIVTNGPAAGIFAAEGNYAKIHHITVTDSVLDGEKCGKTGVGGLVGKMTYTEIYACSVDATVSSPKNYVGGICGWMKSESSIHDCITTGKVTGIGSAQYFAGILGGNIGKGGLVSNCISTAEIETGICAAGIVGHMNEDSSGAKLKLGNQVIGCIAWNPSVVATKCRRNQYSSGGVVGYTAPDNILQNNWRRTDMVFTQNVGIEDAQYPVNYIVLEDQEDADESNPLNVPGDHSTSQEFYYHGKAAAAGETASAVAKRLKWDETIWDLSGDVPALK